METRGSDMLLSTTGGISDSSQLVRGEESELTMNTTIRRISSSGVGNASVVQGFEGLQCLENATHR